MATHEIWTAEGGTPSELVGEFDAPIHEVISTVNDLWKTIEPPKREWDTWPPEGKQPPFAVKLPDGSWYEFGKFIDNTPSLPKSDYDSDEYDDDDGDLIFNRRDLRDLKGIIRERSYRTGDFTLSSGQKSNQYFDLKPTIFNPWGGELIGKMMEQLAVHVRYTGQQHYRGKNYVSGLEVGAVPVIAQMCAADESGITGTFVRKQAKGYGVNAHIEGLAPGESLAGQNVILVEDVCTTGKSFLKAAAALSEAGAQITDAICIVERGGGEALAQEGIRLWTIFRAEEFQ